MMLLFVLILHSPHLPLSPSTHPSTTDLSTLSLHDALPIFPTVDRRPSQWRSCHCGVGHHSGGGDRLNDGQPHNGDRKSTRLNSSHRCISYAVFCLKKKKHKSNQHKPHTHKRKATIDTIQNR